MKTAAQDLKSEETEEWFLLFFYSWVYGYGDIDDLDSVTFLVVGGKNESCVHHDIILIIKRYRFQVQIIVAEDNHVNCCMFIFSLSIRHAFKVTWSYIIISLWCRPPQNDLVSSRFSCTKNLVVEACLADIVHVVDSEPFFH